MAPSRSLFPAPTGQPMKKNNLQSVLDDQDQLGRPRVAPFICISLCVFGTCARDLSAVRTRPPPVGPNFMYGRPPAAHRRHGRRGRAQPPLCGRGPHSPAPVAVAWGGHPARVCHRPFTHRPRVVVGRAGGRGSSPLPHPRTTEKECCRKPLTSQDRPRSGGEREKDQEGVCGVTAARVSACIPSAVPSAVPSAAAE